MKLPEYRHDAFTSMSTGNKTGGRILDSTAIDEAGQSVTPAEYTTANKQQIEKFDL